MPWLVLTRLGSPADAGLVGAAIVLPAVIGAVAGGVITDRLGKRQTSVAADLFSAAAVAAVPILDMTVGLSVPLVSVLAFLGALLDAPGSTARQVMLPDLADRAGVSWERANGFFQTVENTTLLVGPLLAGGLVLWAGPVQALWIDAASFVVSAAMVLALVPQLPKVPDDERVADLMAGIKLLARDRVLRGLTLVAALANFVGTPIFIVVLPVLAVQAMAGPDALGLMLAAFGGGLVTGSLTFGFLGHRLNRRLVLAVAFAGTGLPLVAMYASFPLAPMALLLFLAGLSSGPINPIAFTVMQERVPPATRGRVFGAVLGGILVAAPAGMLVMGAIAETQGPRMALLVAGASFCLVAIVIATRSEFRCMGSAAA